MAGAVWRSASGSVMAVAWDVSAAEWSNMESSAGEGERGLRMDWGCAWRVSVDGFLVDAGTPTVLPPPPSPVRRALFAAGSPLEVGDASTLSMVRFPGVGATDDCGNAARLCAALVPAIWSGLGEDAFGLRAPRTRLLTGEAVMSTDGRVQRTRRGGWVGLSGRVVSCRVVSCRAPLLRENAK